MLWMLAIVFLAERNQFGFNPRHRQLELVLRCRELFLAGASCAAQMSPRGGTTAARGCWSACLDVCSFLRWLLAQMAASGMRVLISVLTL